MQYAKDYTNQPISATLTGTSTSMGIAASAPRRSELLLNNLYGAASELNDTLMFVRGIADRLLGTQPEAVSPNKGEPQHNAKIREIEQVAEGLRALSAELRSQVSRLDTL